MNTIEDAVATVGQTSELVASAPAAEQIITLITVVAPFLAFAAAVIGAWGWGISWVELALLAVMFLASGLGITIGFHRLFTHRSFATLRPIKLALAVMGSMAVEGPLLYWVATHRRHHQLSDQEGDPHSPHAFGGGLWGVLAGCWHAHVGWLFVPRPDLSRYVGDLEEDAGLRRISHLFVLWVTLGLLLPAVAGGLISGTWLGAGLGLLWGGLVRVFLVHHLTWSINSVCHLWGQRPFESQDESRNNVVCGVLAFGEGWHNNHHAFPSSARHGLRWWELDLSYLVIRVLELLGLAWNVRRPAPATVAALRRNRQPQSEGVKAAPAAALRQGSPLST